MSLFDSGGISAAVIVTILPSRQILIDCPSLRVFQGPRSYYFKLELITSCFFISFTLGYRLAKRRIFCQPTASIIYQNSLLHSKQYRERISPYQIHKQKDSPIQHLEKEMEVIIFVTASQQPFPHQLGRKLMAAMCLGVE